MAKEILFYEPIYSYTVAKYISLLEENKNNAIKVRMNCPGGDVYASYGAIAKFAEHQKSKMIQVDGHAASSGLFMICAADEVECLDVTEFLAHRAAYPSWVESDPTRFTEEMRAELKKTNDNLRALIESKVSAIRFSQVTGVSLDDMFSLDKRIDVRFNAQQALNMGIVNKINSLTKQKKTEIIALSHSYGIAAFATDPQLNNEENIPVMDKITAAAFQSANPEAYEEIFKLGVAAEKKRVNTWMVYKDIDPEGVAAGIKDGKEVDSQVMAEMQIKAVAASKLDGLKQDGAAPVDTTETTQKPEAEAKAEDFRKKAKDYAKQFR